MTAKILKANGQIVYLSTYRRLTDDELQAPEEIKLRDNFDKLIHQKLGKPVTPEDLRDFGEDVPTPEYELYDDDFEGTKNNVPDIDDVMPEYQDNYVGAEVNLPIGGVQKSGKVKRRARNEEGELTGVKNDNTILDT